MWCLENLWSLVYTSSETVEVVFTEMGNQNITFSKERFLKTKDKSSDLSEIWETIST